jgi:hypothetical protein|tara:strand:- start:318 stop:443 length:126 start_codon:yes stop_codon:yes gene_type:complete
MNLFDIWFISIVLSISANIILVVLLMTKIGELNEMRNAKWK